MTSPAKLRRGIASGLLVLVAVMPFHAFLSVWLGHLLGHQAIIQSWKEILLLILGVMGAYLVATDVESRDRLRSWPLLWAGVFTVIALIVTAFTRPSFTAIIFGAKTDLEFLVAFGLAVVVASPRLSKLLVTTVLVSSAIVFGFSLLQTYVLPPNFLSYFGYGPSTILPYETIDPAIRSLRFSATLGGPNQLGTFVMLPTLLAAAVAVRRRRWWLLLVSAAGICALFHTYSRAAWIGMAGAALALILALTERRVRAILAGAFAAIVLVAGVVLDRLLRTSKSLQYYVFHGAEGTYSATGSDTLHLQSLEQGLSGSLSRPLGHGLGSAGPAIFHSGTGQIIENNYLQLSYETGVLGGVAFIVLTLSLLVSLARHASRSPLAAACLAALVGISITSLFLPAWTDSSTALIFWTATGVAIGCAPDTHHV